MQDPTDDGVVERSPALLLQPTQDDIRVQLNRILASPEFPAAGHGHAFLRYVVNETLAGRADRIKGYSIAIEVFNRDDGFTQDDPVVRIEAGRLRRTLERYYFTAGQNDAVRIDIPKGKYVPFFTWNAPMAEPAQFDAQPVVVPPGLAGYRGSPLLILTGAFILACAVVFALWMVGPRDMPVRDAAAIEPDGPTLVVAPFANLGDGPESKLYTLGITEELLTALPRFKEIKVFGRETSKSLPSEVDPTQIRNELGARFLLAGGVRVSDHRVRVTARLLDIKSDTILWSETYDGDMDSRKLFDIQSDVANKVATAVAQPYGIIAQTDAANPPPDDLDAYGCTLRFYAYRAQLSVEMHAKVRDCLESTVARFPTYATAWAMLSIIYLDEDRYRYNPRSDTSSPLERSLLAARRAVEMEPDNMRALQAMMTALFFNQQLDESLRVGEQALALNPNDTEFLGEFGVRLAMGGQWQRGAAMLDRALAFNPGGAGYYHGNRALAAFVLGDDKTSLTEIRQANLQKFPLFHLVAAIIFAQNGLIDEAKSEGDAFVASRPTFMPNIEEELSKRNILGEHRERMLAGLRKAGLLTASNVASGRSDLESSQ